MVRVLAGVWRLASSGTVISLSTTLAVVRLLWASNSRGRGGRKISGCGRIEGSGRLWDSGSRGDGGARISSGCCTRSLSEQEFLEVLSHVLVNFGLRVNDVLPEASA